MKKLLTITAAALLTAAPAAANPFNEKDLFSLAIIYGRMMESMHTKCMIYTVFSENMPELEKTLRVTLLQTLVPDWMNDPRYNDSKSYAVKLMLKRFRNKEYAYNGKLCAKFLSEHTRGF